MAILSEPADLRTYGMPPPSSSPAAADRILVRGGLRVRLAPYVQRPLLGSSIIP